MNRILNRTLLAGCGAIALSTSGLSYPTLAQPLPTSTPVTTFTPRGNLVTVELVNETGAVLNYEVLGITDQRTLLPDQSVLLQNLPFDVTLTAVRTDSGLIDVVASSPAPGQLRVAIVQEFNFDDTQGVVLIERSGRVSVN